MGIPTGGGGVNKSGKGNAAKKIGGSGHVPVGRGKAGGGVTPSQKGKGTAGKKPSKG